MNPKSVISLLKEARRKAVERAVEADRANDLLSKVQWQNRRAYLNSTFQYFRARKSRATPGKTVFISYCKTSGMFYFKHLEDQLTQAGFQVLTGFQALQGDQDNVIRRVLGQLARSSVYLALLTKEIEVSVNRGEYEWSPSVWVMEEKGMALALQKPFVLMVEEGIHDDFWRKTAPLKVHEKFKSETFLEKAKIVIESVKSRYEQVAIKALNEGARLPG